MPKLPPTPALRRRRVALLTTAAADRERDAPDVAATFLAEASWHALMAHGPARALELARQAVLLAGDADGDVAVIVRARLGDALQWNGLTPEAQRRVGCRGRAAGIGGPARALHAGRPPRCGQGGSPTRASVPTRRRQGHAPPTTISRSATLSRSRRSARSTSGLLREARASSLEFEAAAGAFPTGERLEAIGVRAWVEALLGDLDACQRYFDAADGVSERSV